MVMCQEVGHDFGLDHQDENFNNPNLGTCMDYTNDPSTNQHPNAHDYEELDIDLRPSRRLGRWREAVQPAQAELPERRGGQRPALLAGEPANGDLYIDAAPGGHRITHVFWAPLG